MRLAISGLKSVEESRKLLSKEIHLIKNISMPTLYILIRFTKPPLTEAPSIQKTLQ
jgi:hypothetical protein